MASVILNPMFTGMSGRTGNMVFFKRYGRQYARAYVSPRNPDTEDQRINRKIFKEAVHAWQKLDESIKILYRKKAEGKSLSGYNLFISQHMKQAVKKTIYRSPLICRKSQGGSHHQSLFGTTPFHLRYRYNTAVICPAYRSRPVPRGQGTPLLH